MINKEINLNFYPSNIDLEKQISQFFNINSERLFLERLRKEGIDKRQIAFYGREQVLKFLLEFAAGVKKTQIIYELDSQDKLVYPAVGLHMENMLSQAVQQSSGNRELSELLGWQRVQAIISGQADQVLQISAPDRTNLQHGTYGFVFWFERQGNQVVNHILRYDENRQSLARSHYLATIFGINTASEKTNPADIWLAEPRGFQIDRQATESLLKQLGFSLDNRGTMLEQALLQDRAFGLEFSRYQQQLFSCQFNQSAILTTLANLYRLTQNKAVSIGLLDRRPQEMFLPLIFGGGSCPVIGRHGFGYYDFSAYLYGEPFTCPSCHHVSYVPVGNKCPHCKITKEEWKKKQEKAKGDCFDLCD